MRFTNLPSETSCIIAIRLFLCTCTLSRLVCEFVPKLQAARRIRSMIVSCRDSAADLKIVARQDLNVAPRSWRFHSLSRSQLSTLSLPPKSSGGGQLSNQFGRHV